MSFHIPTAVEVILVLLDSFSLRKKTGNDLVTKLQQKQHKFALIKPKTISDNHDTTS